MIMQLKLIWTYENLTVKNRICSICIKDDYKQLSSILALFFKLHEMGLLNPMHSYNLAGDG